MGYRCDGCQKAISPGLSCHLVQAIKRKKQYTYRKAVNRPIKYMEKGKLKVMFPDDPGGFGYETVRELKLCATCAEKTATPVL